MKDKSVYTLYYDCQHCHGSGCDICGYSGKSSHIVDKETAERLIASNQKWDNKHKRRIGLNQVKR